MPIVSTPPLDSGRRKILDPRDPFGDIRDVLAWPVHDRFSRRSASGEHIGQSAPETVGIRNNDATVSFYLGNKGQDYQHPLFLKEGDSLFRGSDNERVKVNLSALGHQWLTAMTEHVLQRAAAMSGLSYVFGLLCSPTYRQRYRVLLKDDFPRVPLTRNPELFRALARLGSELVALYLLESPKLDHLGTKFIGSRNPEVERVSWSQQSVWLDKAQDAGFCGVPDAVWSFHIGGYQVCEKWLKDRRGRVLSKEDIEHYCKIVGAIQETIRLMGEIDKVIDAHGGWPGAFITDPKVLEGLKPGKV